MDRRGGGVLSAVIVDEAVAGSFDCIFIPLHLICCISEALGFIWHGTLILGERGEQNVIIIT